MIEKAAWDVFRCSLSGRAFDRWLEVPVWMFDRAASIGCRIAAVPHVEVAALADLATLLRDAATISGTSSQSQDSGAPSVSHDANRGEVHAAHTELRLPKRRRGQRNATPGDIVTAVRQLVLIASDDVIAGILNRNGLVTGNGNRWTRERVTALRSYRKVPVFRPAADGIEPWHNLNKAARLLGITPKTLRLAAEAGKIEGLHPLPDGPWIFRRSELGKPDSQQIVHRARQNPKYPTGSHPDQQNLFTSTA